MQAGGFKEAVEKGRPDTGAEKNTGSRRRARGRTPVCNPAGARRHREGRVLEKPGREATDSPDGSLPHPSGRLFDRDEAVSQERPTGQGHSHAAEGRGSRQRRVVESDGTYGRGAGRSGF